MAYTIERERLQECFELIDDIVTKQEERGEAFDSEATTQLAIRAVAAFVPELFSWKGERVVFDVERCFAALSENASVDQSLHFTDAQFRGILAKANLVQRIQRSEEIPEIALMTYDICAIVTPRIDKVSDDGLVLSERVIVPLRDARFIVRDV